MTEEKLECKTLREWRKEFGFSQRELAELAGCKKGAISSFEEGRTTPSSPTGRRVAAALGLQKEQIARGSCPVVGVDTSVWPDDGFAETTPRRTLQSWREKRSVSQRELARLSGLNVGYIYDLENERRSSVRPATRRVLAKALHVATDKLILPGDETPTTTEQNIETLLRADLRGARSALKKAHDFMRNDAAITFRWQDTRDAVLPDIERELRGL